MSIYDTRIRNHQVWTAMERLGPSIDKAVQVETLSQDAREALERLRAVLALCGKRLGGADPLTVAPTTLDTLANALSNQQTQVDAFVSDGDIAHLNDANSNADAMVLNLNQLPSVSTPEELIELVRLISRYRAEIDSAALNWSHAVAKAKGEVGDLDTRLNVFKRELEAAGAEMKDQLGVERQKIANQAIEFQKSFTEAQESRSNTYTETLRKTQETLSNTLSEQQGQFSTAQESRGVQFTAAVTDMQKRFSELIGDYTKRLADQDADFKKAQDAFNRDADKRISELEVDYSGRAGIILDAVKKRQEEVETLVGVIGSLGVTSGYQKTANSAQKSMWLWQGVAVTSMIAVIGFASYAFLPTLKGDFHWSGFVARVFLTVTVGVLAAYAATQADRFFNIERQNRRLALELAAIDPFIALFPEEEQQKFKLEIGRRSFGQDSSGGSIPVGKSPATTLDVLVATKEGQETLKILADIISKLPKVPG